MSFKPNDCDFLPAQKIRLFARLIGNNPDRKFEHFRYKYSFLNVKTFTTPLVDFTTQLTLLTWICQLSRRWDPSKGGGKMFGASLPPGKDIWRRFLCKIYTVCPYKLVTCKQNASKKVQNLLKTAVSAARQSHPRNEEQACSKSHMDFSGSDLHISH